MRNLRKGALLVYLISFRTTLDQTIKSRSLLVGEDLSIFHFIFSFNSSLTWAYKVKGCILHEIKATTLGLCPLGDRIFQNRLDVVPLKHWTYFLFRCSCELDHNQQDKNSYVCFNLNSIISKLVNFIYLFRNREINLLQMFIFNYFNSQDSTAKVLDAPLLLFI